MKILRLFMCLTFSLVGGCVSQQQQQQQEKNEDTRQHINTNVAKKDSVTSARPGSEFESTPEPVPRQMVVKLRVERVYTLSITEKALFGRRKSHKETTTTINSGTGFFFANNLVTARHLLVGPSLGSGDILNGHVIGQHEGVNTEIKNVTMRIRVSTKGLEPEYMYIHKEKDVAVLKMRGEDREDLRVEKLASMARGTPVLDDKVVAWGYPANARNPIPRDMGKNGPMRITKVQDDYFVVSADLGPGYSGGPVFRGSDCLGMVYRTGAIEAYVVRMNVIYKRKRAYEGPFRYKDGMSIMDWF